MGRTAQFDYYYGQQADQYTFYRIPKVLFTDEYFRELSCEAKVLYGLMLDRMSLSIKNRWFDENNRVYIIFTVEDVMDLMNCKNQKAVRILAELDSNKGIGLIEKKRMGLGKANIIYVKNFILQEHMDDNYVIEEEEKDSEKPLNTQKCENHISRDVKSTLPEIRKSHFKECENHTSRDVKSTLPEVPKSHSNYNNINYTDFSDNKSNQSIISDSVEKKKMDEIDAYRAIICENIEYESLCSQYPKDEVDGMVELMIEVLLSKKSEIRIAGDDISSALVKSRFMKMNYSHMEYVFECLKKNTTKVGNIKQYLLTALYNAPATMGRYYGAEVNHDLYGG